MSNERHQERKVALRTLIDCFDTLDDDEHFDALLKVATVTGFTSLARDVRLIRVRIETAKRNAESAIKKLTARTQA